MRLYEMGLNQWGGWKMRVGYDSGWAYKKGEIYKPEEFTKRGACLNEK